MSNETFTTYSWRKPDAGFMRTTASTIVAFLLPALLVLGVTVSPRSARAFDSTLFYAPPDPQPMPPLAVERNAKSGPEAASAHVSTHSRPPSGRTCFSHEEARDRITALGLSEPYRALQIGQQQGEALRAKLCRWKKDEFVYEIAVLRRDGRIVHVYMNAQNGKDVAP